MRNITLSVDDALLESARAAARKRGTSLNALIREYLEALAGRNPKEEHLKALLKLLREKPGDSGGRKIKREEAYEGRLRW